MPTNCYRNQYGEMICDYVAPIAEKQPLLFDPITWPWWLALLGLILSAAAFFGLILLLIYIAEKIHNTYTFFKLQREAINRIESSVVDIDYNVRELKNRKRSRK
jgi:hypothetical protein